MRGVLREGGRIVSRFLVVEQSAGVMRIIDSKRGRSFVSCPDGVPPLTQRQTCDVICAAMNAAEARGEFYPDERNSNRRQLGTRRSIWCGCRDGRRKLARRDACSNRRVRSGSRHNRKVES